MVTEWREEEGSENTIKDSRLELGRPALKLGRGVRTTSRLCRAQWMGGERDGPRVSGLGDCIAAAAIS